MNAEAIIKMVKDELVGRYADAGDASEVLLATVQAAGEGNYLELGVLHAGSLCAVALLKKELGHAGVCVGVDLFDGWYKQRTGRDLDRSNTPVTLAVAKGNIAYFGLDNVELVQSNTHDYVPEKTFVVSFVDAEHTEEGCWLDWLKVKEVTTKFVVFHDYMLIDGVTKACKRAEQDPDWRVFFEREGCFVLRKND